MMVNHSKVDRSIKIFGNEHARTIIKELSENRAKTYTELRNVIREKSRSRNLSAFYLRKLLDCKIVRKDEDTHTYYLTRIGVRMLELVERFEEFYTEYDMNDVDQDGKVRKICIVEGQLN